MDISVLTAAREFISDYWLYISGVTVTVPAVATAIFAYLRRSKSSASETGRYFTDTGLLSPPLARPAYSDRMAYVLAEMSDLAYYQFEGQSGFVDDAVESALSLDLTTDANVREFLDEFSSDVMSGRRLSLKFLAQVLGNSGFSLLDVIDVAETQGFVCKRITDNEPSYLVLAFRGTETKVSDWLTDARCVPTIKGKAKVHTGFLEAFVEKKDAAGRTAKDVVEEILDRPDAKYEDGKPLPLFITGHSLGGALALLATKLVAPNVNDACYTFGAPRVGNYECFRFIKTPVYRIRQLQRRRPKSAAWGSHDGTEGHRQSDFVAHRFRSCGFSSLFDKIETLMDTLNGYRHFGDLRYLSDVGAGRFKDVRLLSNPPAIDRIVWMWRRAAKSIFVPIKSHNMNIYRKKLAYIANDRNGAQGG